MLGLISSSNPSGASMDTCGVKVAATAARRCINSRSRSASRARGSMSGDAASAAPRVMLAGCQDLKPLQADIDNLKQQVSRLNADLAAAKSSADAANAAAQSASSTASGAQSAANQALAAAQASQSCCDATNEKIDRMFRRSISK